MITRFIVRFKTLVLALFLLLCSVRMMFSGVSTEGFQLRTMLFSVAVSIESSLVVVGDTLKNIFTGMQHIRTLEARLSNTEQRLQKYLEYSFRYEQLKAENDHYRTVLSLKERVIQKSYYAKVIFRDPSLLSESLIIDKGRIDGIKQSMPVVVVTSNDKMMLVGKISEAGRTSSKVQLITSKNFFVGVRLADTGYTGIINGRGSWNQDLVLNYIPVEVDPSLGEEVVTSGESEIYPEGLLVGTVRGIGQNVMEEYFQILYVNPEFNYTKIPEVFVLNVENKYADAEAFRDGNL